MANDHNSGTSLHTYWSSGQITGYIATVLRLATMASAMDLSLSGFLIDADVAIILSFLSVVCYLYFTACFPSLRWGGVAAAFFFHVVGAVSS